ncbi:MAG: hypothetical protein PWP18_536 [Thermoanaerobacter sp.]|nr:hypothetical protein [Thermoanaerobacter sp.]
MIEGILPYLIIIALYLAMSFFSKLYKHKGFWIIGLIFVLFFVGFKDKMSPDLKRYAFMYENYGMLSHKLIEPGFIFFAFILNKLGFSWVALFFVYSSLTILFIVLGIKNFSDKIVFAFLIFLLVPGFFLNMWVEIRQMLALSLVFYAVSLINVNTRYKKFKFILSLFSSIIFHYSSIIFWLLFFSLKKFLPRKFSFYTYSVILLVSIIIPFIDMDEFIFKIVNKILSYFSIMAKYTYYFESYLERKEAGLNFFNLLKSMTYTFLGFFISFYYNKFNKFHGYDRTNNILLNLFVIGVLILNISIFNNPISRIAYYFLIYQIVLIPNLIYKFEKKETKILILYLFLLFYFAQFLKGLFYYSTEAESYIFLHYKNVLINRILGGN